MRALRSGTPNPSTQEVCSGSLPAPQLAPGARTRRLDLEWPPAPQLVCTPRPSPPNSDPLCCFPVPSHYALGSLPQSAVLARLGKTPGLRRGALPLGQVWSWASSTPSLAQCAGGATIPAPGQHACGPCGEASCSSGAICWDADPGGSGLGTSLCGPLPPASRVVFRNSRGSQQEQPK